MLKQQQAASTTGAACFCYAFVGITGLEPATSRPPEATQLALNPVENEPYRTILKYVSDGFRDGFTSRWIKLQYFNSRFDSLESGVKVLYYREICKYNCCLFLKMHILRWHFNKTDYN